MGDIRPMTQPSEHLNHLRRLAGIPPVSRSQSTQIFYDNGVAGEITETAQKTLDRAMKSLDEDMKKLDKDMEQMGKDMDAAFTPRKRAARKPTARKKTINLGDLQSPYIPLKVNDKRSSLPPRPTPPPPPPRRIVPAPMDFGWPKISAYFTGLLTSFFEAVGSATTRKPKNDKGGPQEPTP